MGRRERPVGEKDKRNSLSTSSSSWTWFGAITNGVKGWVHGLVGLVQGFWECEIVC